jgi:hypothetical protein
MNITPAKFCVNLFKSSMAILGEIRKPCNGIAPAAEQNRQFNHTACHNCVPKKDGGISGCSKKNVPKSERFFDNRYMDKMRSRLFAGPCLSPPASPIAGRPQ